VKEAIVALSRWESVLVELFQRTGKFPRVLRYSLTSRIENAGLDVMERLLEAAKDRGTTESVMAAIGRLRILLRLAVELHAMDRRGHEHLSRRIDDVREPLDLG
jgi:hypothetical protein